MFSFELFTFFAYLISFVLASPAVEKRIDASTRCGQYDSTPAGQYSLNLDQWGKAGATSGQSCASLISISGTTVAWKTAWTWNGGSGVKAYTNMQLNAGLNKKLSAIKSMPTSWNWSQSSSSVKADVAYDLFTANAPGGNNVNEIMIWLAAFNMNPISTAYNAMGGAVPLVSNISLAGHTWDLFKGPNGNTAVYSFLPTNGARISSFTGDLNVFLKYLTQHQGVSASQYLKTAQGGTEAMTGSATLTTSAYSLSIN